jgi:hypothetical protein
VGRGRKEIISALHPSLRTLHCLFLPDTKTTKRRQPLSSRSLASYRWCAYPQSIPIGFYHPSFHSLEVPTRCKDFRAITPKGCASRPTRWFRVPHPCGSKQGCDVVSIHRSVVLGIRRNPIFRKVDDNLMTILGHAGRLGKETHVFIGFLVGLGGLEPPTSPLSGVRSSHLSYRPNSYANATRYQA